MSTDLREELDALARTQTFTPDPAAWDRGRRARRRSRAAAVVAALVLVASVGGLAATWSSGREAHTASGEVPGGALPSRIGEGRVAFGTWPPQGRASVAYVEGGGFVLVGAEDASYRLYAAEEPSLALGGRHPLVALSPDGWRLAWTATQGLGVADLRTGEVTRWVPDLGNGAGVTSLSWRAGSTQLMWDGRSGGSPASGVIDVIRPSETIDTPGTYGTVGVPSPDLGAVALPSDGVVTSAPFLLPARGGAGKPVGRTLPADLLPDGAEVTPLGWASDDLVVAVVDPPPGAEPQPPRLALLTSPERPESSWIYREFLPRVPPVESLSVAVDLVPDLTGDPDQELTHDFSASPSGTDRGAWEPPYAVLGVVALLAGFVLVGVSVRRRP